MESRKRSIGLNPTSYMKFKDHLSLLISVLAITVSISSFYFSNIRINNQLSARIIQIDLESNGLVAHVAFMNQGNRQAIVSQVDYLLTGCNAYSFGDPDLDGFGDQFRNTDVFPFILQANEMRMVELNIPEQFIVDNYTSGKRINDSSYNQDFYCFHCSLKYRSIDSEGRMHDTYGSNIQEIDVDSISILGTGPLSKEPSGINSYPLEVLFSD